MDREGGRVLHSRVAVARSFSARLCGLLGRPPLAPDEGLWIAPCASIHMVGMKFPVDAVFADAEGRILRVFETLAPGFRFARAPGAGVCLEGPPGWARRMGVERGLRIRLDEDGSDERSSSYSR